MRLSTLRATIGLTAVLGAVPATALGTQDVYGIWRHPGNGSLIQIYPCDGAICAKVVWVLDPASKDINNPDPALRDRPVVGVEIWRHAKETARLQWSGSAYNPLDGATHYGTLHLTGDTTLVVESCNLNVMPCFELTWTKVDAVTAKAVSTMVLQPQLFQPREEPAQPTAAPAAEKTAIAEKPKAPSAHRAKKQKARPKTKAKGSSDPHGYNDLPHIHIR